MKRRLTWLVVGGFVLLGSLYFEQHALQVGRHPVAEKPQAEESKPEVKAATPEDPGPIATVAAPLAVWTRKNGKKAQEPPQVGVPPAQHFSDHVVITSAPHPENFLHQTFRVKHYAKFEFVVTGYVKNPRLHGRFHAWEELHGPESESRKTAVVELLLLTEPEFAEFVHGEHGTVSNTAGPSSSQLVDWALAATSRRPRKYYLVFRNPAERGATRFVEADFTIEFE